MRSAFLPPAHRFFARSSALLDEFVMPLRMLRHSWFQRKRSDGSPTMAQTSPIGVEYLCWCNIYHSFSTVSFLTGVDGSQNAAGSQARDDDGCYDFADVVLSIEVDQRVDGIKDI